MAIEQIGENLYRLEPGPADAHSHPRAFDVQTQDTFVAVNEGEGKAGLRVYTEVALASGFTVMVMMPNEQLRLYDPTSPELTRLVPYPLSNRDRILATESLISNEAVIPVGINMGVDPEELFIDEAREHLNYGLIYERFSNVEAGVVGLKLWGDESTGGYNVHPKHIPRLVRMWHTRNPDKPVTLHLEDGNVRRVLQDINSMEHGKEMPVHIAHVSSQEELEAVIEAKQAGMNVTCEVTVHHLFLDSTIREKLGGYGCMKPTLKTQKDIAFLWANMKYIDIIASDCAPHRRSDKEAGKPAFGVTNYPVMLPLLFGAVADGKITHEELYQKLCITPRKRFNLPLNDGSFIEYDTGISDDLATAHRQSLERIGYNPFPMLDQRFRMIGQVVNARAGVSTLAEMRPSYSHLVRPTNLGLSIVRAAQA